MDIKKLVKIGDADATVGQGLTCESVEKIVMGFIGSYFTKGGLEEQLSEKLGVQVTLEDVSEGLDEYFTNFCLWGCVDGSDGDQIDIYFYYLLGRGDMMFIASCEVY